MQQLSSKSRILLLALAHSALVACEGEPIYYYPDTGGATSRDAGQTSDAQPALDATPGADATPPPDAAPGQDTGPSPDAGPTPDTGPALDATPGQDTGPLPDSGPRADAGRPPPSGTAYENASEAVHQLTEILDLTGNYGVAMGGGHLVASNANGGTGFPRETTLSTTDQINIPAGATVRHAFLWYSAPIFLKPGMHGDGDYTTDLGGPLDTAADIAGNGITFRINNANHGPFDPTSRLAPNPSNVGSQSQLSSEVVDFSFGTWTGIRETVWANRLDITGLFAGQSGNVSVTVNPPERLDLNGNSAARNAGNPAGNTTYNLCSGAASWAVMVIYELPSLPRKNLVLMDGPFARAWDYIFFHHGTWQRPKIRINHAPIQQGAKFYTYVASGQPAGSSLPGSPACSCGCGGQYTLRNRSGGLGINNYFSNTHVDPAQTVNDPMHRDRTNGPWYLYNGGLPQSITGNDWTLFQSADVYTEFPNLYEGAEAPAADNIQPVTNENNTDAGGDTYRGHPWAGRGTVTYHATGNAISIVEVALHNSKIVPGETTSYLYLKGDQKDVWKPQHIISMKWLLFETPL